MFIPQKRGPTPIYETSPASRFASVNAGDNALYVGGLGINLAFAKHVPTAELFTALHQEAMKRAAKAGPGTTVEVPLCDKFVPGVSQCFARSGPNPADCTVGCAILTVFKEECRPLNSNNNLAMVYTVGPRGSKVANATEFLELCRAVGDNIKKVVCDYNSLYELQAIQTLRVSLVSGGAYKHKQVSKQQVARQLILGLGTIPKVTIEFAYDDNAFREAAATL